MGDRLAAQRRGYGPAKLYHQGVGQIGGAGERILKAVQPVVLGIDKALQEIDRFGLRGHQQRLDNAALRFSLR